MDDNIQIATAILRILKSAVISCLYSILLQEITDVTNPNKLVSPNRKVQL
jgi:hypothetical protein